MPRMLAAIEPYSIVESNLRHAMRFYAGCSPAGGVTNAAGMELTSCGFNYPIFNSALISSDLQLNGEAVRDGIIRAGSHFNLLKLGWSSWFCHDLLTKPASETLAAICARHRLSFVLSAPGMFTRELTPPVPNRHTAPMRIEQVSDETSRLALAHLISVIFELPFTTTLNIYGTRKPWNGDFAAFVGYCDGAPATVAMINNDRGSCGFYSVGTLPEFRRHGLAAALMMHAAQHAKNNWNSNCYVLQSTTAGRRLYEKLGFQAVTRFSVFRSPAG